MVRTQFGKVLVMERDRDVISYFLRIYIITVFVIFVPSLSYANTGLSEDIPSTNDVSQGTLLLRSTSQNTVSPAPSLHTNVHITITGLIARTTVQQEFENPGSDWAEGIYVFPLPETAAVDHLRMHIGERMIEGMIQERTEAKKTYNKAKQEGRRVSLIEQERPNMFTTSVANIGPKERITIEIEYQETVTYDQREFSLRFPMTVGPRYAPGSQDTIHEHIKGVDGRGWARNTNQVPDASRITPPVQHPDQTQQNFITLTVDLAPGFPLADFSSTYHEVHHSITDQGILNITLKNKQVPVDRDFELTWKPKSENAPQTAVFTEQHKGSTYTMAMLIPPIHAATDLNTLPRDVTFIIDTSGSMHGLSIEQSKLALQRALTRLTSQDRFNIIQFNNVTQTLFSSSQAVTSRNIHKATQYIHSLVAEGGTEILPALQRALKNYDTESYLHQIIFITDGQVGNEEQLFQAIQQDLRHTRLFTVGIGSAPNSYFMRNAAKFGRGTFTYIGNASEVQKTMDSLFEKLEHPVITDIAVELPEESQVEVVPTRIPDLYIGEPILVVMRSTKLLKQVKITGRSGTRNWDTTLSLDDIPQRQGLAVYWARKKITALVDSDMKRGENPAIRKHITDIALTHHLVSRYTSLVAVDVTPSRSSNQPFSTHTMKTHLPHGQDYTAIFGLAAGATPGPWHLSLGLLLLLVAGASYQWTRICT